MSEQISINELAKIEVALQQGLKACYRLKKKLGSSATDPSTRKGLSQEKKTHVLAVRHKHRMRKAS
jgi:hypothetical protein